MADLAAAVGTTPRSIRHARESGALPARFFVQAGKYQKLRADYFSQAANIMTAIVRPRLGRTPEPASEPDTISLEELAESAGVCLCEVYRAIDDGRIRLEWLVEVNECA